VVEVSTGKELYEKGGDFRGFSPDSKKAIFSPARGSKLINIVEFHTSPPVVKSIPFPVVGSGNFPSLARYSHNMRYLLYASMALIEVYDFSTNEVIPIIRGKVRGPREFAVNFSSDDTLVSITAVNVGTIVFDLVRKKKIFSISKVGRWAAFSEDNKGIILACDEPPALQWWSLDGRLLNQFHLTGEPHRFVQRGSQLIIGDVADNVYVVSPNDPHWAAKPFSPLATTGIEVWVDK